MNVTGVTWDHIVTARRLADGIPIAKALEAARAVALIRNLIGEDVSRLAPRLFEILINQAPWTYRWVAWFVDCLRRLGSCEGYTQLLNRIIDPARFDEALSVVEVADRLEAAGLQIGFETPVMVAGLRKLPDLHVFDPTTGTRFYCEVSVMFSSDNDVDASRALNAIFWCFIAHGQEDLSRAGLLWMPESQEELTGLVERLRWEAMEVRKDQTFREVIVPGALEFALAPKSQAHIVKEWAEARALPPEGFGAVPREIDHFRRLAGKIAEKVKQLPEGFSNILVIPGQTLFVGVSNPAELVPIAKQVLPEFPMVAALVLSAVFMNSSGWQSTPLGEDLFTCSERDGQGNQFLVILNPGAAVPLSAEVMGKLHEAFSL